MMTESNNQLIIKNLLTYLLDQLDSDWRPVRDPDETKQLNFVVRDVFDSM